MSQNWRVYRKELLAMIYVQRLGWINNWFSNILLFTRNIFLQELAMWCCQTLRITNSARQWHKQALSVDVSLTVAVAPKDYIAATKPMLHTNTCKYRAVLESLAKVAQGSSPICGPLLPVIPPLALSQSLIPFPVISLSCPVSNKAMKRLQNIMIGGKKKNTGIVLWDQILTHDVIEMWKKGGVCPSGLEGKKSVRQASSNNKQAGHWHMCPSIQCLIREIQTLVWGSYQWRQSNPPGASQSGSSIAADRGITGRRYLMDAVMETTLYGPTNIAGVQRLKRRPPVRRRIEKTTPLNPSHAKSLLMANPTNCWFALRVSRV